MKIYGLFICLILTFNLMGQLDSVRLEHNNASAFISNAGTYFFDFENQENGYEVPKGSGVHALKNMQLWFAAKDSNNQIHFSQGGVPGQGSDIFNGPISTAEVYDLQQYIEGWSKPIWAVCQSTIDEYFAQFECSLDPDCDDIFLLSEEELNSIYNWPAHGDVSMGQAFYLAPFYDNPGSDLSGDGIYDPLQGDVPQIKGCCAAYIIQNDEAQPHTLTNTEPIGIDLRVLFYQYSSSDYLNEATFVEVQAFNRSGQDYSEFVHSIAIEAALGNASDDFFGCDSLSNTMYFYNADNYDEANASSIGYGENPPAIGIVGLHHNISSSVPFTGEETVSEKWNLMTGFQANGNPWNHPDGFETKYVYSGNPNILGEWNELEVENTPGNARGLLSFNFGAFNDGDFLKQTYAIIYARDGNHLANVESVISNAIDLKSLYESETGILCTESTMNIENQDDLSVAIVPNPSSGIFQVRNPNKHTLSLAVYDAQGRNIANPSTSNLKVIEIDLSERQPGIFLVQIISNDKVITKKVIIH